MASAPAGRQGTGETVFGEAEEEAGALWHGSWGL